jgi:hypothetical protein
VGAGASGGCGTSAAQSGGKSRLGGRRDARTAPVEVTPMDVTPTEVALAGVPRQEVAVGR